MTLKNESGIILFNGTYIFYTILFIGTGAPVAFNIGVVYFLYEWFDDAGTAITVAKSLYTSKNGSFYKFVAAGPIG